MLTKLKLALLMSLGILTVSISIGQTVTLSHSNTPKAEYRYNYNKVDFNYSIVLDTGINLVWDLSNMVIQNETKSYYYTKDPNYDSFPGHEYHEIYSVPVDNSDTTYLRSDDAIYKTTDTLFLQSHRIIQTPWGEVYIGNCDIPVLKFPFDYNSYMDLGSYIGLNYMGLPTSTTTWKKGDATGSLILPDSILTDLLRLHTYYNYNNQDGNHSGYGRRKNTYEWYAQNSEIAFFKVEYSHSSYWDMGPSYNYGYDTTAWLLTSVEFVPMEENNDENPFIYPNPSSNFIILETKGEISAISIFDSYGKLMNDIKEPESEIIQMYWVDDELQYINGYTLDINDYTSGIYYINCLLTNGEILKKRFMVEN